MSFWIPGYRRDGRRPLYSISAPPLVILGMMAILIAVLLPVISWLRSLFP